MITISGVRERDRMSVAQSIVMVLGVGGVCEKELEKRLVECASKTGGMRCSACAAENYIKFVDEEEGGTPLYEEEVQ